MSFKCPVLDSYFPLHPKYLFQIPLNFKEFQLRENNNNKKSHLNTGGRNSGGRKMKNVFNRQDVSVLLRRQSYRVEYL